MQIRYRMQSLRTGWGVEAELTAAGKKELERIRKKNPKKFKFCRVYPVRQMMPSHEKFLEPFKLTHRKYAHLY